MTGLRISPTPPSSGDRCPPQGDRPYQESEIFHSSQISHLSDGVVCAPGKTKPTNRDPQRRTNPRPAPNEPETIEGSRGETNPTDLSRSAGEFPDEPRG